MKRCSRPPGSTRKWRAVARRVCSDDLRDFVACYQTKDRRKRAETERFKAFDLEALLARDKANLDLFWLKDDDLEASENLPAPDILAREIVEDLEAALLAFTSVETALGSESE